MKKIGIILTILFCGVTAHSKNVRYQSGYYKEYMKTYVESYYKTSPNNINLDNFSTKGNYNYYTGEKGIRAQDHSSDSIPSISIKEALEKIDQDRIRKKRESVGGLKTVDDMAKDFNVDLQSKPMNGITYNEQASELRRLGYQGFIESGVDYSQQIEALQSQRRSEEWIEYITIIAIVIMFFIIGYAFHRIIKTIIRKDKEKTYPINNQRSEYKPTKNQEVSKVTIRNKYSVLINHILNRNSYYQMREIDANNVKLICTGITFTLTEVNRNLQITYVWDSFSTGKTYRHQWRFNENKDQNEMYEEIDKEIGIQSMIDSGFTREQAEDIAEIKYAKSQAEQEALLYIFSKKHPHLWEMMN
ncbi:hypothetical protein [uncultured Capnocytophaga sp.]|uniref:hypothetical protein n=1 Tax=uncultured Capnocytophaga sp. TaxID=159273 RepID=UPI0026109FCF|nr:hypothetical protein [uncultured Capnocytophaga sp.]